MRDSPSKTITIPTMVESVRERLIEDIMERRYIPGQKLPVVEIASRYGVSETPVKQAFNRLISERLLVALPRRGVVVRHVAREEVRELMEARQMVYLASVDAAIRFPAEQNQAMRESLQENLNEHQLLLQEIKDRLTIDIYLRYVRIDREYHSTYLKCANNRIIEQFFNQLNNQAYTCVSLASFSGHMTDRIRNAFTDHTAVFEAWCSGDRQRMTDELMHHKEGAIATLFRVFETEGG